MALLAALVSYEVVPMVVASERLNSCSSDRSRLGRPPWRLCTTDGRICSIPQKTLVRTVGLSSHYSANGSSRADRLIRKLGGTPWRPLTIHPP